MNSKNYENYGGDNEEEEEDNDRNRKIKGKITI